MGIWWKTVGWIEDTILQSLVSFLIAFHELQKAED